MRRPCTRRRVLATTGAALTTGLAGCPAGTGGGDGGDGAPDPTVSGESPASPTASTAAPGSVRFTSVPDLFNADIPYPMAGWEPALDWFLHRLEREGPAFTLVAGDIMDARWWASRKQVRLYANAYWGGYVRRMRDHDITLYPAVGDHELGDDEWENRDTYGLTPTFERQFVRQFDTPRNGPEGYEGLAYTVRRGDLLVVTVDTFERRDGAVNVSVTGAQLEWLRSVLSATDAAHVVVQGHVPVLRPVKSRHSSALYLDGGRESGFWRALAEFGVDAYLCGEHHAITVDRADGVWQVTHGALWGAHSPVNYLVGAVGPNGLRLELKRFPLEYGGPTIYQLNRPKPFVKSTVTVPERVRENGPRSAGRVRIGADGASRERTGVFE
jgi:hypothetical protein